MVVFYVSGHGYGHATRTAAVIRALRRMEPALPVAVRTAAPAMLFDADIEHNRVPVEGGVSETADALAVDVEATVRNTREFLHNSESFLRAEEDFLRARNARVIAGDIPFIAGELARRTRLTAIAAGNFTWHWVLDSTQDKELLAAIRRGYSGYSLALRMPLSPDEGWTDFPEVVRVPLVTPRSTRPREEIRQELGLTRRAILLGGRGTLTGESLHRVRRESPEFHFLLPGDGPVYSDLLRAADVVASKIGYSISAECIAEGKRLLYPPRTGFREESVLRRDVPLHTPAVEIPVTDWNAGNWRPYLLRLLDLPQANLSLPVNGAEMCAEIITTFVRR